MDFVHLSIFCLIFISLQYILLITEIGDYCDLTSDIQGYRFNFYKDKQGNFAPLRSFVFIVGYIVIAVFFYVYCIMPNMGYTESFIFISIIYLFWDGCLFTLFDKGLHHLPVLLYDSFVVGGFGMVTILYIFNNFYSTLKNYLPFLIIFYFTTMVAFLYEFWKYNP